MNISLGPSITIPLISTMICSVLFSLFCEIKCLKHLSHHISIRPGFTRMNNKIYAKIHLQLNRIWVSHHIYWCQDQCWDISDVNCILFFNFFLTAVKLNFIWKLSNLNSGMWIWRPKTGSATRRSTCGESLKYVNSMRPEQTTCTDPSPSHPPHFTHPHI